MLLLFMKQNSTVSTHQCTLIIYMIKCLIAKGTHPLELNFTTEYRFVYGDNGGKMSIVHCWVKNLTIVNHGKLNVVIKNKANDP